MAMEFDYNGSLPNYTDLNAKLYKNQHTIFVFDWNHIYRNYEYIPYIGNYDFRLSVITTSDLANEYNVVQLLDTQSGGIVVDMDKEKIYAKIDGKYTKHLRSYDSGVFSLDMGPKDEGVIEDYDNAGAFYRLCAGRWTVDKVMNVNIPPEWVTWYDDANHPTGKDTSLPYEYDVVLKAQNNYRSTYVNII